MKVVSRKQIKFNRGQVSDLLSERADMGLQNACGTVYDNMYINRYGQLQSSPVCMLASDGFLYSGPGSLDTHCKIIGMFDTGEDFVFPVGIDSTRSYICLFDSLSKTNKYHMTPSKYPLYKIALNNQMVSDWEIKFYQFGYNVILFGQNFQPILLNITPNDNISTGWASPQFTVKENYFDGAFDNIYIRGTNTSVPADFTVPTTGTYIIGNSQEQITTARIVTVNRNGAGGAFTQSLVGQVIDSPANGGSLQVRSVESGDSLTATVLSPLVALSATAQDIRIPWSSTTSGIGGIVYTGNSAHWRFGYERPYGTWAIPGQGGAYKRSYPNSCIYVNQRLVFGGNDFHGNLISASRIGVINDFDPESATESDAFTTQIASKDFCRIVDFIVSNNELRIACTNGEYAMSLSNLTPSGSLNGFDLRSEVGIKKGTAICDCGGLTAYTSWDGGSVYGTQFSLLRDRYQPISLTSQTENMIINCNQLKYLTNRANNEGNCLVGLNDDSSLFVGGIDLNAGLINISKIQSKSYGAKTTPDDTYNLVKLFSAGGALWGQISEKRFGRDNILVRFSLNEMFDLPFWIDFYNTHPNTLTINTDSTALLPVNKIRALYYNSTTKNYEIIAPTGTTDNGDGTTTYNFADNITVTNIVVAGIPVQCDWRSVEISVGMATRELNKRIVKLEGVIEPTQITGRGRFAGLTLTPEQAKNFITLTRSKDVEQMDVDNLANTSYTEDQDVVWRRAFDNPDRELHFGVSMVAPFLIKSITATIEYDEVA